MRRPLPMIVLSMAALSAAWVGAADFPPNAERNAAWVEADADRLSGFYTEEARVMTPNFPSVTGHANIHAMFTRMMGRTMTMHFTVVEDFESADLWVRRTDYEMRVGGQAIDDGEAIEVWRRVDGRWLLHLETFTSRNIRPIAYDDPAPEYDRIRVRPAPDESSPAPTSMLPLGKPDAVDNLDQQEETEPPRDEAPPPA